MKSYYNFLKAHFSGVSFGWLLTFFSSFGQTFLISLYIPELMKTFQVSEGVFGNIYAACTVVASVIMLTVGHTIDHHPVRKVTYFTIAGLAGSCVLLSLSWHWAVLLIAITGLRLTGQGLTGHISLTVMSRYYTKNRGKAISISSLGYSIGEAVFPVIIASLITGIGWQLTGLASAGILVLFWIGLAFTRLEAYDQISTNEKSGKKQLASDYWDFVKDRRFSLLAPAVFVLPFTMTGVFFYQYVIAESKGWDTTLYAMFFTGYAVTRFIFSLTAGQWIDRYSAARLYRIYLLPLLFGLIPLALIDHITGALIFLLFTGISMGMSSPVKSALMAELYGTEKLGTVRSLFTMIMISSTALGPLLIGNLMDVDMPLHWIIGIVIILVLAALLNAQRIRNFQQVE